MRNKIDHVAFLKVRHVLEASGISTDPDFLGSPQTAVAAFLPSSPRRVAFLTKSVLSGEAHIWDLTPPSSHRATLAGDP